MRPIEPNVEPNSDPRCAHRETTTDTYGLPYTVINHVDDCSCATGLTVAANVVQLPACRTSYAIGSTPYPYNPTAHVNGCDCSAGAGTLQVPAHLLMNDPAAEAEAARVAAAYEAMLADPGTPNWPGVLLAAARLYTELTGRTFPTPDVDDTPEDVARARLGKLGAAIGLELIHHLIDTDDEQPLVAAAAEVTAHGDIPEPIIAAIAPPFADLLTHAINAIEAARKGGE